MWAQPMIIVSVGHSWDGVSVTTSPHGGSVVANSCLRMYENLMRDVKEREINMNGMMIELTLCLKPMNTDTQRRALPPKAWVPHLGGQS